MVGRRSERAPEEQANAAESPENRSSAVSHFRCANKTRGPVRPRGLNFFAMFFPQHNYFAFGAGTGTAGAGGIGAAVGVAAGFGAALGASADPPLQQLAQRCRTTHL